jgi:LSD1 subclass zinc finger protein
MSVKIKKINIHAFRGIPDLELELDGKSLLLRGENGSGKSSIVEAIEFFFTGKVAHLEGVQGLSLRRHGPHVNFKPEDVNISITFNPGNIFLSRTFASAPSPPSPLEEYFQITRKGTFILRRSQILEFIMSQPAERFRAIGSIIGIEQLDNVELEMMRLRDELEGKVKSKKKEVERLIKELSDIVGKDITTIDDVISVLNAILRSAGLPLIKSLEDVDKHAEEMLKSVKKVEILDKIKVLNEILELTKNPLITKETVGELTSLNEKIRYLLRDEARVKLSVGDLLETGRKIIEQEKLDVCPLCEQKIERESLLARINTRLTTLRDLSNKASEIRRISVPVIDSLKRVSNNLGVLISKIEPFPELSKEKEILLGKLNSLNIFIEKVVSGKDLQNEIPVREIVQQKDEINQVISSIYKISNQLLKDIGLTEEEKRVLEIVRLIERARSKTKDISKTNIELMTNQKYLELAEKIYSAFSETKKTKIQEVYNIIQADIQSFYSMLHPNEPHRNIELMVAPGRRASTEMKIESFGREGEDPRALTSEGHLDSLGLCIFLAFVKKFNEGCPLVILDDVITTIDANHRNKVAELLLREFKDYQLIITTHDGIWYDQLLNFQRALNVQDDFINMEITWWDVNTGPMLSPYKPRWEKILDKLKNNDRSGAGNECRMYLEWLLKEICEKMEVAVPFMRSGRYTVRELFDPAEKRIEDKLKDGDLKKDLLNKFKNLKATTFMGNLLSHDNPEIENLSIEEVKTFCNAVHDLHETFLCPQCRKFLKYFRDSKIVRCSDLRCESPKKEMTK